MASGSSEERVMTAARGRFTASLLPLAGVLCFLYAPPILGQQRGVSSQPNLQPTSATVSVSVRAQDGSPFDRSVLVNLYSFSGAAVGIGKTGAGQTEFGNLAVGRYTLEVIAPGYQKLTQSVEVSFGGQHEVVYVTLTPESDPRVDSSAPGAPILAPNAQKELNNALEALRNDKLDEAKKHLEKASRNAPANPDVSYVWGMYYLESKDLANAKASWEKAVQVYPHHGFSLAALAQLAAQAGDLPAAIGYLARAVEATPSSWRFQERLADVYLQHQEYEQAQKHAERALELGKDRASQAQLTLAKALIPQNQPKRALKALDTFLAAQPSGPQAAEARQLSDALRRPAPATTPGAPTTPDPHPLTIEPAKPEAAVKPAAPSAAVAEDLVPPQKWMPPDIDESMPSIEPGVACPLETVRSEAGKRVHEFIDAVNRISATESLDDEIIDRSGMATRRESRNFSYVASVSEIRPGMYNVEEYRNGTMGLDVFPTRIATIGLTSLVMIFHPAYSDDYEVSCEGLSRWHGGLAWQVHFRQKPEKPPRLREYRIGGQSFPISLRGRAWIATDTFQVVSLETDIVAPVERIRLKAEHTSIEYMPVRFSTHNQELWLPQSAELFFDYGGRKMHRRHHFRNYMLFSVDEKQRISAPKIEAEADPGPSGPGQHQD
jgi:tetratricopeptide (TPR) repeat protein